jgi:phytoene dehydrogenase-like protein
MLFPYLQEATKQFRDNWKYLLGVPYKTSQTAHWSRIKALTRRLSYFNQDHYNYILMPVADLLREITSQLNIYLSMPSSYFPETALEDIKQEVIEAIKSSIYEKMHEFVRDAIWKDEKQMSNWYTAYNFNGGGSTFDRSSKIDNIYQIGAPELNSYTPGMHPDQKKFVNRVVSIIKEAIEEEGGKIIAFSYNL